MCSGRVFKGNWSKVEVALKVLKTDAGATPSFKVCPIFSDLDRWFS